MPFAAAAAASVDRTAAVAAAGTGGYSEMPLTNGDLRCDHPRASAETWKRIHDPPFRPVDGAVAAAASSSAATEVIHRRTCHSALLPVAVDTSAGDSSAGDIRRRPLLPHVD